MSEWRECRLGDVAEIFGGGTPKTEVPEYWNGSIPWITPRDLSNFNGRFILKGVRNISDLGLCSSSAKLLPKGSVLLSSRAPVGYLAISDCPIATNQGFRNLVSIPNKSETMFLYYLLKANVEYLISQSSGTTFQELAGGVLKELLFIIPSLPEQRAIAGVLSSLDDKIDLLHRQNKTLEGMAEALWRKMFVEEAKTDWPTKQLKDLCTITRGASPRPIIEYVKDGTVPWIKIADATASGSYFIDRTNEFIIEAGVSKSVKVSPGDLILSNSATCGFPYFVELEGCIHDGWLLFRNFMGISKLFVFFFLKQLNEELNYIADGSVQNNLNTGLLKEYKLKAPPFNLVKDFDDFGEIAVTRIRKNTIQIRTLSRLRDTLLPKLMSGEVRVAV